MTAQAIHEMLKTMQPDGEFQQMTGVHWSMSFETEPVPSSSPSPGTVNTALIGGPLSKLVDAMKLAREAATFLTEMEETAFLPGHDHEIIRVFKTARVALEQQDSCFKECIQSELARLGRGQSPESR